MELVTSFKSSSQLQTANSLMQNRIRRRILSLQLENSKASSPQWLPESSPVLKTLVSLSWGNYHISRSSQSFCAKCIHRAFPLHAFYEGKSLISKKFAKQRIRFRTPALCFVHPFTLKLQECPTWFKCFDISLQTNWDAVQWANAYYGGVSGSKCSSILKVFVSVFGISSSA